MSVLRTKDGHTIIVFGSGTVGVTSAVNSVTGHPSILLHAIRVNEDLSKYVGISSESLHRNAVRLEFKRPDDVETLIRQLIHAFKASAFGEDGLHALLNGIGRALDRELGEGVEGRERTNARLGNAVKDLKQKLKNT